MTKLLLIDLDNTIREPLSGAKFISHPKDQKIISGADKALAHYHKIGWTILGISNQGGVAAGFKSLEDAIAEQKYTLQLFPQIDYIFFCPDFEGSSCWGVGRGRAKSSEIGYASPQFAGTFRKPNPGMLRLAQTILQNPREVWYVGDREEDVGAAAAAGVKYLDAAIWRSRFLPGLHEMPSLTKEQIEFLEGVEL